MSPSSPLFRLIKSKKLFKQTQIFAVLVGLFLIIYGLRHQLIEIEIPKESKPYVLMGTFYILVAAFFFLYRYIETDTKGTTNYNSGTIDQLRRDIKLMKLTISNSVLSSGGSGSNSENIEKIVQDKINSSVESTIKSYIDSTFEDSAIKSKKSKAIDHQITELQIGVNNQIGKLSRSGTINLLIGVFTTLTAFAILLSLVFSVKNTEFNSTKDFLVYFLPRVSLAIFIEVFSFFFLRLYKRNLEDVKYFHNERTNIDSKIIALKTAILIDNEELLQYITKSFTNVERNFILKKGETTTNLERLRLDKEEGIDFMSKISDIIEKIKK